MGLSLNKVPRFSARKPRYRVAFESHMMIGGRMPVPVVVRDMSDEGLMIVTDSSCPPGTQVSIELPELGRVEAIVRWAEDGCLGAEFVVPLPTLPKAENLERRSGPRAEYPQLNLVREGFAAKSLKPPADEAAE